MTTQTKRALSILEAAAYLGISRSQVYRLMTDGSLKNVKIGARRLITRDACDALLEAGVNRDEQDAA
ncbi:MAG: DNA binding domain, excisionase family [Oceanicaulis sp. HLUCCA04]|nr:MAG: DNA binding domain, excisionase family [Oceanicaulis sp. HLUCCA04]